MTRYYHVAPATYQQGDDLLCFDALWERGGEPPVWKWGGDDWFDTDVVCLFRLRAEAEEFRAEFLADGRILTVDLPDDVRMTTVDEGYPAVFRKIPRDYIQ